MVIKFIPNKKGGSSKSLDYLLNEREQLGTARLLQGDQNLTREIINSISYKQKVTVGVMSFEERNIDESLKYKLMQDLEQTLFPGMSKDQYNICWIEHTDKDRLELNFVIPKIELNTQKALQPYYHNADLPRLDKLERIMNIEHNFTDPKAPEKARTLEVNNKELHIAKDYIELDNQLHNLVENGSIKSRDHMLELLKENNYTITRESEEGLSIRLPESKRAKKFKGGIYSEQFTSTRQLISISKEAKQRAREYNNRNTQRELRVLKQELREYNETKSKKLREQYKSESKNYQSESLERDNNSNNSKLHNRSNFNDLSRESGYQVASTTEVPSDDKRGSVSQIYEERHLKIEEQENQLHQNKRVNKNDSFRKSITERVGTRKRSEFRAYSTSRQARIELHKSNGKDNTELHERARQLREKQLPLIGKSENFGQEIKRAVSSLERFEPKINRYAEFGKRVKNYISDTREKLKEQYNSYLDRFQELKHKLSSSQEFFNSTYKQVKEQSKELSFQDVERASGAFKSNNEHEKSEVKKETLLKLERQRELQKIRERERNDSYSMSR